MPRLLPVILAIIALAAIGAVCLHSLEEIHYLKSFFPASFTVQQARDAAVVELIKVAIIALPLVLIIAVCLFFYREHSKR